jgi:hypothetical protein
LIVVGGVCKEELGRRRDAPTTTIGGHNPWSDNLDEPNSIAVAYVANASGIKQNRETLERPGWTIEPWLLTDFGDCAETLPPANTLVARKSFQEHFYKCCVGCPNGRRDVECDIEINITGGRVIPPTHLDKVEVPD